MAGAFEDFPLEWAGQDCTIPATRRMGAIAAVEEVITLPELMAMCQREAVPLGKLSAAYGALLRYAGARVTDEDVYTGMFADGDFVSAAAVALQGLMSLLIPPSAIRESEAEKKTEPAKRRKSSSSKGSTKPSSGQAGSRRPNSGA